MFRSFILNLKVFKFVIFFLETSGEKAEEGKKDSIDEAVYESNGVKEDTTNALTES